MFKKRFVLCVTAIFLCLSVAFSGISVFAVNNSEPNAVDDKVAVSFPFVFFRSQPDFSFSSIKKVFWYGKKVKVLKYYKHFTYVEVVATKEKGYIFSSFLDDDEEGDLKISESYFNVYEDQKRTSLIKVDYNGNKNVTWQLNKTGIVEVTEERDGSLSVKGLSPGTVTLTIKAGAFEEKRCTLTCVYKWKKAWTGKAGTDTDVRKGPDTDYDTWAELSAGKKFVVYGDDGSSDGWAYGNLSGTDVWGFVKINDISSKGTISQYDLMNWSWPIKNVEYNYINSPYGKRDTEPAKHKGIDIATNWSENQTSISGQTVVSAFEGTVDYVCINDSLSWGYCVSIISSEDIVDPVSGKQFVAIYMHMKNKPKASRGKKVKSGTELGYVGNTGNSTGAHLHFEVNNKTASIYESNGKEASDSGRSSYNDLVNPIFFYMSFNHQYNEESAAERKYYGTYWYGSE